MEQKKEVGTKDSSLSTLHNTVFLYRFPFVSGFSTASAFSVCWGLPPVCSFFLFCFIGLSIFPALLPRFFRFSAFRLPAYGET